MKKQHRTAKESYRIRTHLIHGNHESKHWDFDHHLVPPISASAAYRLGSVHRGAQGFVEFASDEADVKGHVPIYIYDRLDEPTFGHGRHTPLDARHSHRRRAVCQYPENSTN